MSPHSGHSALVGGFPSTTLKVNLPHRGQCVESIQAVIFVLASVGHASRPVCDGSEGNSPYRYHTAETAEFISRPEARGPG